VRYHAPSRETVDAAIFEQQPFLDWVADYGDLLRGSAWPSLAEYDRLRLRVESGDLIARPTFAAQTPELLADGLHYEQRIAEGRLATREENWHDLLNALVWLRYPRIKQALNRAQVADIAKVGPRQRTRAQCAMTHFDEAGAIVLVSDPDLVQRWDAHDWQTLFFEQRDAWGKRINVLVFGHAVLEHALRNDSLLVAKSLVLRADASLVQRMAEPSTRERIDRRIADLIASSSLLLDPQELRPLPLSGIPGWHPGTESDAFYREAPCFRPVREGRLYPEVHDF
jgi:hypothetical protein